MVCEKTGYSTHRAAHDAIAHVAPKQRKGMGCYRCNECGMFHIYTVRKSPMEPKKEDKYKHSQPYINKPWILTVRPRRQNSYGNELSTGKPFKELLRDIRIENEKALP